MSHVVVDGSDDYYTKKRSNNYYSIPVADVDGKMKDTQIQRQS